MCIDLNRDVFASLVSELARAHTQGLVAVARREGLEAEDALDAVQEAFHTFLKLPQAKALLEEPGEARTLLAVLVRNTARNLRRRHHRSQPHEEIESVELAAEEPSIEAVLERAEQQAQLVGCMRRLDDVQRTIVNLRMLEELSGAEVARAVDLTPAHVAVLLYRAKKELLQCMRE